MTKDPYAYNGVSPVRVLDNEKGYVRNGKTEAWFDPQKHDPVLISRIFNADLGDEAIEDLSK